MKKVKIIFGKYKGRNGMLGDKIDCNHYEVRLFSKKYYPKYSRTIIVNEKYIGKQNEII